MDNRVATEHRERGSFQISTFSEMATVGLRDQDRLDGSSNYVIWKARMSFLLDEHGLKAYINNLVAVPQDPNQLKEYEREMAKAKRMILDGVRDHIVSHISGQNMTKEM